MAKVRLQEHMMAARGYVTPQRAAELTGRHLTNVYAWIKAGRIKTVRNGYRLYIERASLEAYMPVARAG